MPRKRTATTKRVPRNPVLAEDLRVMGESEFKGGVKRPRVVTASVDPSKGRQARLATGGGLGVGGQRWRQAGAGEKSAGMLIDNVQTSRAFLSGYALEAYRTSFANGLNNRAGTCDIPGYFVQMNQLNGGILYWPVTLQEKYQWFRYFCYYVSADFPSPVLMADGTTKSLKDVEVGDEVVTGKGTIRKVKEKLIRHCKDDKAVRIKAWCLQDESMTTQEHPFFILRKNNVKAADGEHSLPEKLFRPEWVDAEFVEVGDYVLMAPYKPEVESAITDEQAAFLGYYAAEGSLIWEKRCVGTDKDGEGKGWKWHQEKVKVPVGVSFSLNKDEKDTLAAEIIALASSVFGVKGRIARERGNTIEVVVNGRNVAEFCHLHVGFGSCDKKLSKEMLDASVPAKRSFLTRYMEGDGHQYDETTSNKGKILTVTSSDALASQVQVLAISAGIMCRIAKYDRTNPERWNSKPYVWHISVPSWSARDLIGRSVKWGQADAREDQHCAFFINGYAAFKVREITYCEKDDTVYNLEIDAEGDEKSFICNGMVAHNCRTDSYVGRAMDLLTDLPMSKLTLNMPKMQGKEQLRQEILDFYRYQIEKIGLFEICQNILFEMNCMGNVYLFHEYGEESMMWERVIMLPPEEVYVFQYPFSDNKRVEYRPERLMALIKSEGKEMILGQAGLSEEIIKHIPQEMIDMVRREGCIVMDSDPMTGSFVAHIARRKPPYMDLGASILERILVPLLQKENYRYTQLSLANRNMTPKNIISAPGLLQEELDDLRTQVDLSYLDPDYSIITNYEVTWNQIGAQDRLLNLDSEYERLDNQCFAAMGVTRELLTGEGSYSGNKITVEILNTMFLLTREVLKSYIEKQLFMPLAERHGWFEVGQFGAKKYYYPQVGFNRLTIRDNNEVFESLYQLYQKGSLPVGIILELFNLNEEDITERLLHDAFTIKDPTFNRLLEEVHSEVGRNLSQTTNVLERITEGLGLTITQQPGQEGGAPGGGGFGGFGGETAAPPAVAPEVPTEAPPEAVPATPAVQATPPAPVPEAPSSGPTTEDLADVVAENIPAHATDQDIAEVVERVQSGPVSRGRKLTIEDVANEVAENLPPGASEDDIRDVVDRVTE